MLTSASRSHQGLLRGEGAGCTATGTRARATDVVSEGMARTS